MSAEEMAEMAYILLEDLGYTSDRDWFNKRIFLTPNNEAFFSIFQYLLTFADPQIYNDKFKRCLPLFDKRREGDFRRILCSYLQELADNGELVEVPPIKMALFTTPGRSAFLQVLLAVIEWVSRKKSNELNIILPPYDAPEESVRTALNFFGKQKDIDTNLAEELRREMQSQMELLVSDLLGTEEAVQAIRGELTRAQEQTMTTEEDEVNLRRFSNALAELVSLSGSLRKLHAIAQSDAPSRDAIAIVGNIPETLLQAVPEVLSLFDDLNEQISHGEIDMLLYMRLVTKILRNRSTSFNDVIEKLSAGSAIDKTLGYQRSSLQRAEEALHRFGDLIERKTKAITEGVRDDHEADEDALILAIDPPAITDLKELVHMSGGDLDLVGEDSMPLQRVEAMPPPTKTNLIRKKIGNLNLKVSNSHSADLSGFSLLATPIPAQPRIEKLRNERVKRRSIKEVFTSTPFAKPL